MLNDGHISRHGHLSLGLPRRLPGEWDNAALEVSLSDLSSAFNPSWDLGWFQVLDLTVENLRGASDGFRPWPTQRFLPIAVWEGDALKTVQGIYRWTSTSAGADRLPYEFLTPRESEGNSFQTERCGVPIHRAMFSRQRACFLVRARNKPIRFSSSSLSDFRVVYPCGTSPLSTACITLGYASERRPRR